MMFERDWPSNLSNYSTLPSEPDWDLCIRQGQGIDKHTLPITDTKSWHVHI